MDDSSPVVEQEITIRPAKITDVSNMTRVLQSHYNWINVWNQPQSVIHRNVSEDWMSSAVADNPAVVAELDEQIVGFAISRPQEPQLLELRHLYVDDPYRNSGTGRALIKAFEDLAASRGYTNVFATSSDSWYPEKRMPITLFERCGYSVSRLDEHTYMFVRKLENASERPETELAAGITEIHRIPWIR